MYDKDMKQFVEEFLSLSVVRGALKSRVKQIDKLENLDELKDLRLTGVNVVMDMICMIHYEATATKDLYPNIRARLIEKGVIKKHNALKLDVENKGKVDEYEQLRFGIWGNTLQVLLKVYNPGYKK